MIGHIDSIETMGLVDGPGVRFVVFMQGCPLRCLFCHNPETWNLQREDVIKISSDDLLQKILKLKNYYKNGGGVTFSGGEPMLQPDFLIDILKKCQENGIHTAIDTCGVGLGNTQDILKHVDLVILDIKAYDEEKYEYVTKRKMNECNKFLDICQKMKKKLWIRQVIIPGINDTEEYVLGLKDYLKKLKHIEKIELLPYHLYGVEKYKKLNIPYPLEDVPPMDQEKLNELIKLLN